VKILNFIYAATLISIIYYLKTSCDEININSLLRVACVSFIYRMCIKEFYTFKMIYKTNAANLELHTHTDRQTLKVMFQITWW
jgi:hypothetical protein